jgi:hypothetical protein
MLRVIGQNTRPSHAPIAHWFVAPALRKVREERGTPLLGAAGEIKRLGHPPEALSVVEGGAERFRRFCETWARPPSLSLASVAITASPHVFLQT